ncbi:MAG TPA: glutamine synthetase adenylyltransferase, partial [Planctomycetaceae bacterium]|nr:glutamine synthetase adenylyltransferase [Planctomycetaceae bacterium]
MSTTTAQSGLTAPSLQQIELLARGAALPAREQRKLLEPLGFADAAGAAARLGRLADAETLPTLVELLPTLLLSLAEASDPDMALVNLERFVQSVSDRASLYRYFREEPRAVEILVKLFVGSQFLSEILIRNPRYLEQVTQHRRLAELKSREQFVEEAREVVAACRSETEMLDALRRFQRWEILRIAACDVFGLVNLKSVTIQLASLADSLVRVCLENAGELPAGFSVLALGKLGGEELNYSSDIDLVFLAPSTAPDCWRVARKLIRALSDQTAEGFLYRVDMRLRPWGNSGTLVTTPHSYLEYLEKNAQLWEKQALLKARVIAGDPAAGQAFLAQAQQWVFADEPDAMRTSVLSAKQRIEADLQRRGHHWGEVKLGIGSIRDVEFVVQYLQLIHGGLLPEIRTFNTLDALVRLADASLLHADEYRTLNDGYLFLRTIEHSLQLMHNKQCHRLPADPQELKYLARRLDFASASQFLTHYERHCAAIREIYERRLGIGTPEGPDQSRTPGSVARHVSRMEQSYTETFTGDEITRHAEMAQRIDDERLMELDAIPLDGDRWRVTIVAYDYLGELSLICGLLFAYGFDILEGQVFTYAPDRTDGDRPEDARRKIVDAFTVRAAHETVGPDIWVRYARELQRLLQLVHTGNPAQARDRLIQRVGAAIAENNGNPSLLYPVEIAINNAISDRYTVLEITSRDTLGFLYELTNSLAMNGVYIAQVGFHSQGDYAHDTLYVTRADGGKITGEQAHRELRAAVVLTKHFTHLLPHSANPAAALVHFREFLTELFARPNWPDELASVEQPDVLDALARLLGNSDFLWNDFLRMQHANLFPVLSDASVRGRSYSRDDLVALVQAEL